MRTMIAAAFSWALMSATVVLAATPKSQEHVATTKLTREGIVGVWRLTRIDYVGPNGPLSDPVFGTNPQGIVIYDRTGWMSVQIVTANRPTMKKPASRVSDPMTSEDAKQAAQALNTYYAYFGTWDFDAGTSAAIHHLTASLLPHETGLDYRREAAVHGKHLKLPVQLDQNGEMRQRTLDLTRFSGHITVTQRGVQNVEARQEIYERISVPDGTACASGP